MKYKLYTKSSSAWSAMIKEIKSAKKSIYIEMYIFLLDIGGKYDFVSALKERALAGVKVVIVTDARGSSELKPELIEELKKTGIEILFFSTWLRRTHRKIFIVDERISFLGGVNLKKSTSNWNDLQIKMISPLLTKNILKSFAYTYKMSGGKNEYLLGKIKGNIFKTIKAQFLEHLPNQSIYTLKNYYTEAFSGANSSLTIVTPYFTPPRWLMALMDLAVKRGVKIEIIIPEDTDLKILNRINRAYILKLKDTGLNFYFQNSMNHAKLLLIDDATALIGSQNLDLASFNINLESSVSIKNKKLIEDLKSVVDSWKSNSRLVIISDEKVSFWDKFFLALMRFLYPIL